MSQIFRLTPSQRALIHRVASEAWPPYVRQRAAVIQLLDAGISLQVVVDATGLL